MLTGRREQGGTSGQLSALCSLLSALCLRGLKELRAQPVPCTVTDGPKYCVTLAGLYSVQVAVQVAVENKVKW